MTTPVLSSSEVILEALRRDHSRMSEKVAARVPGLLEPMGTPVREAGQCAFCGKAMAAGDLHIPLAVGPAFMDDLYMAARGSALVCEYCAPFHTADGLIATQAGVFSVEDGYLPFGEWKAVAHALLNPPAPPFVMLKATAKNQHMAWRCPVNYSRDLYYVRVGLRDVRIRRLVLAQAMEDAVALGTAVQALLAALGKKASPRKTLPNPFVAMDGDLKSIQHCEYLWSVLPSNEVSPCVFDVANGDPRLSERLHRLQQISLGESWALRFLLTPNAGTESAA